MSQHKEIKDRKCDHCKTVISTDAKGIRQHAEECSKQRKAVIARMKSPIFVHGQVGE